MSKSQINSVLKSVQKITRNNFIFHDMIGVGGFGKVWKVQFQKTSLLFSLKEMSKSKVIRKNSKDNIYKEKEIMSSLYHPFIVNMYATFQDQDNLYMLMDYLAFSDLRYQISRVTSFTEAQIKFFAANIILGLEYIHKMGFVHRDIKPENLLLDDKGFLHISDFGIACKKNEKNYFNEMSGTPGYMPPEVLSEQNFYYESDYFALGIICYELMMNDRPFNQKNRHQMLKEFEKIEDIHLTPESSSFSEELCDFVNKLLIKDHTMRLGANGVEEIKNHKLFKSLNWRRLYHKNVRSPFIPKPYGRKSHHSISSNKTNDNEDSSSDSNDAEKHGNSFINYSCVHLIPNKPSFFYNSGLRASNSTGNILKSPSEFTPRKLVLKPKDFQTPLKPVERITKKKLSLNSVSKMKCELPSINKSSTLTNDNSILGKSNLFQAVLPNQIYIRKSSTKELRKKFFDQSTMLKGIKPMPKLTQRKSALNVLYFKGKSLSSVSCL